MFEVRTMQFQKDGLYMLRLVVMHTTAPRPIVVFKEAPFTINEVKRIRTIFERYEYPLRAKLQHVRLLFGKEKSLHLSLRALARYNDEIVSLRQDKFNGMLIELGDEFTQKFDEWFDWQTDLISNFAGTSGAYLFTKENWDEADINPLRREFMNKSCTVR